VRLGANLTGTSGSDLRLDPQALIPNQVTGPLNSKWLHPYGGFEYRFSKEYRQSSLGLLRLPRRSDVRGGW